MWLYVEGILLNERTIVSVEKRISEITPSDRRITIIGMVVGRGVNYILVQDDTGVARVYTEEPNKYKVKKPVMVIGLVSTVSQSSIELIEEQIVDLSGLELTIYLKTRELEETLKGLEKLVM